jgi:hypothetical protein
VPFWNWLFDQNPLDVSGERFAAQKEDPPLLAPKTPASLGEVAPKLQSTR